MRPGEQVICVDASKNPHTDYSMFSGWVKEGQKYTVRTVEDSGNRILLEEIKNSPIYFSHVMGKAEPGFSKKRFANYEDYVMGKYENAELEKVEINLN